MTDPQATFNDLSHTFSETFDPIEVLHHLVYRFVGKTAFSTSFGIEDPGHRAPYFYPWVARSGIYIGYWAQFSGDLLDLGRTVERYGQTIETYSPQTTALESLLAQKGPDD